MNGYYYTDGSRIYYTGPTARVAYPLVEVEESTLDAEIVLDDVLDAEVVG